MKNKTRNSNIEILRILSMLMIISLHYMLQGGILNALVPGDRNYSFAWLIESICYSSVNCYVLISGYFLCGKEKTEGKKIVDLISQVFFYSVGIYLLLCVFGEAKFSLLTLITGYMFPVIHGEYWFATVYIVSLFTVPYISKLIDVLDEQNHKRLLIIFGVIFSVILTVIFFAGKTIGLEKGYSLIWFVYLYFFAAYIRKFNINPPKKYLLVGFVFFSIIPFVVKMTQQFIFGTEYWDFYSYTSVPVVISSVCLFLLFFKRKRAQIKID